MYPCQCRPQTGGYRLLITGLTFLVDLSDELRGCLVSQLFCQSSTGAGDGGDNNQRVHSDGWQRGRGSGIVSV